MLRRFEDAHIHFCSNVKRCKFLNTLGISQRGAQTNERFGAQTVHTLQKISYYFICILKLFAKLDETTARFSAAYTPFCLFCGV